MIKPLNWTRSNKLVIAYEFSDYYLATNYQFGVNLVNKDTSMTVGYFLAKFPEGSIQTFYPTDGSVIEMKLSRNHGGSYISCEKFKQVVDEDGCVDEYSHIKELSFESLEEARAIGNFLLDSTCTEVINNA